MSGSATGEGFFPALFQDKRSQRMVGHGLRRIAKSANPQPCPTVLTALTTSK